MPNDSSMRTVLVALGSGLAVALAKAVVAVVTGSAAMAAEAAHSLSDTANDLFLFVAQRRSTRRPDDRHPLGYGREAYFWALIAALGVFVAGAAFSLREGITELIHPSVTSSFTVAYIVLAISTVFDLVSFRQSAGQMIHRGVALGVDLGDAGPFRRGVPGQLVQDDAVGALEHGLRRGDPLHRVDRALLSSSRQAAELIPSMVPPVLKAAAHTGPRAASHALSWARIVARSAGDALTWPTARRRSGRRRSRSGSRSTARWRSSASKSSRIKALTGERSLQVGVPTVANTIASYRRETTAWNISPER